MIPKRRSPGPGRRGLEAPSGACIFTPKPLPENRQDDLAKAKNDALKLLSFRARSCAELGRRLKEKGYESSIIQEVIEIFKRQRLIDDSAFADELVRSKAAFGASGRRRIERDLKAKGVPASEITRALKPFSPEEEIKRAVEVAQKRLGILKDLPRIKQRQRLFGFLVRRGFSADAVNAAFRKVFSMHTDLE